LQFQSQRINVRIFIGILGEILKKNLIGYYWKDGLTANQLEYEFNTWMVAK